MNALLETVTIIVGIVAGCMAARAAAEIIVRQWDGELREDRGRDLGRWN